MQTNNYAYQLGRSSKKYLCPVCKHKTFKRYVDAQGNQLAEHVGRCDRSNHCAHHYPPKQFFADTNTTPPPVVEQPNAPVRVDYIPRSLMLQTFAGVPHTGFVQYLVGVFGKQAALRAAFAYNIGRSKQDGGSACIFWQVDAQGNIRSGKIIAYNAQTGKRIKQDEALATGRGLRDYKGNYIPCLSVNTGVKKLLNDKQMQFTLCFFGEHLLPLHPHKPVAIVESEKTAVICSILAPNFLWLATGGASGCKWRQFDVYKVLQGRTVIFYPDHGYYNLAKQTTCFTEWLQRVNCLQRSLTGRFKVSVLLETYFKDKPREDQDVADVLLELQKRFA